VNFQEFWYWAGEFSSFRTGISDGSGSVRSTLRWVRNSPSAPLALLAKHSFRYLNTFAHTVQQSSIEIMPFIFLSTSSRRIERRLMVWIRMYRRCFLAQRVERNVTLCTTCGQEVVNRVLYVDFSVLLSIWACSLVELLRYSYNWLFGYLREKHDRFIMDVVVAFTLYKNHKPYRCRCRYF